MIKHLFWIACLGFQGAIAQVAVPPLRGHVNDLTATLDASQAAALERKLQAFEVKKGSQLAVLIVPTTEPEDIAQFGIRVADAWKLGREKEDDGAILLVAKNDRALRIEVGDGLEGALTDALSKRIIDGTIVPHFKQGDFYGGIDAGMDLMMRAVDGEALPAPKPAPVSDEFGGIGGSLIFVFMAIMIGAAVLRPMFGKLFGSLLTGGGGALVTYVLTQVIWMSVLAAVAGFLYALIFGALGGGGGGRWKGGGRGGGFGGFGGGFGGGRGGGGGGGFSGGGASGRW